ncbi:MAG: hypothetical protein DRN15_03250 [Thermoprotei archaeon]|nr:MAG: hypothetical protein DRM97_07985 [Thermoprotei archaeon]RLF24415.1 MAG: hypothetical protein DRN15_03250 [Thermoprotei archaeon]
MKSLEEAIRLLKDARTKLESLYADFTRWEGATAGRKLLFYEIIEDVEEAIEILEKLKCSLK